MSESTLLLFDVDGTLLRSGGAGLRAFNRTFEEQHGAADAFDGIPVAGRTDPWLLAEAASRAGLSLSADARQRFHDRYCELLAGEIAHPGSRKGLLPGVRTLIPRLNTRPELSVALLTGNFARAARIKLEYFGLWPYFSCGAFGDDAPARDDLVPVAMARAARTCAVLRSAADVIVIGDTPLDIRCAAAGGARSIAVATGSYDETVLAAHRADAVLPNLADIDLFLETLAAVRTRRTVSGSRDSRPSEAEEDGQRSGWRSAR